MFDVIISMATFLEHPASTALNFAHSKRLAALDGGSLDVDPPITKARPMINFWFSNVGQRETLFINLSFLGILHFLSRSLPPSWIIL